MSYEKVNIYVQGNLEPVGTCEIEGQGQRIVVPEINDKGNILYNMPIGPSFEKLVATNFEAIVKMNGSHENEFRFSLITADPKHIETIHSGCALLPSDLPGSYENGVLKFELVEIIYQNRIMRKV